MSTSCYEKSSNPYAAMQKQRRQDLPTIFGGPLAGSPTDTPPDPRYAESLLTKMFQDSGERQISGTGRPQRRSAGRQPMQDGFVDSNTVIADSDDILSEADESQQGYDDGASDSDSYGPSKKRKKTEKKRKRKSKSESPAPPPFSPEIPEDLPDEMFFGNDPVVAGQTDTDVDMNVPVLPPMQITVNVPEGHTGPIVVNVQLQDFFARAQALIGKSTLQDSQQPDAPSSTAPPATESHAAERTKASFLTLPPEIRNKIYRLVLVSKRTIWFPKPDKSHHLSAALLRTCKKVHQEGRTILYAENAFRFDHDGRSRGVMWEAVWKEVGYKDLRIFLKRIGPINIALMRSFCIIFEDYTRQGTPYFATNEERRFVNDEVLLDALRILGRDSKLHSFHMCFHGKRITSVSDIKFIEALTRVKADIVTIGPMRDDQYWNPSHPKVYEDVKEILFEKMTRKEGDKLYPGRPPMTKGSNKRTSPDI